MCSSVFSRMMLCCAAQAFNGMLQCPYATLTDSGGSTSRALALACAALSLSAARAVLAGQSRVNSRKVMSGQGWDAAKTLLTQLREPASAWPGRVPDNSSSYQ